MTTEPTDKIAQYGEIILRQLEGWSVVKIAKEMGIARGTIYIWREDPVYKALEREAHRQSHDAAVSDFKSAVVEAVRTVREIMRRTDLNPKVSAVRLAAAKVVLEHSGLIKSAGDSPLDAMSEDQLDELAERVGYQRVDVNPSGEAH